MKWIMTLLMLTAYIQPPHAQTLVWDANTEEDLWGYKVYQSRSDIGPWQVIGELECGPNDESCSRFPISQTRGIRFHYAVTAVNHSEMESEKSDSVDYFERNPNPPDRPQNPRIDP